MFTILDYSSALEYSIIRRYTNIVYYYYIIIIIIITVVCMHNGHHHSSLSILFVNVDCYVPILDQTVLFLAICNILYSWM